MKNHQLVHIVNSSKIHNPTIASTAMQLAPNAVVLEHNSKQEFEHCFSQSKPEWQIVVTDLPFFHLSPNVQPFVPIIRLANPHATPVGTLNSETRSTLESNTPVAIEDIELQLGEAISSVQLYHKLKSGASKLSSLNEREHMIVNMATEGVPNKTIARRLNVSVKTIEQCRRNAYLKLSVSSSAEVASVVTFGKFFGLLSAPAPLTTMPTQT